MTLESGLAPGLPDAAEAERLAKDCGLPFRASLTKDDVDPALVARVPIAWARRCACLPLAETADGGLDVALSAPRALDQGSKRRRITHVATEHLDSSAPPLQLRDSAPRTHEAPK